MMVGSRWSDGYDAEIYLLVNHCVESSPKCDIFYNAEHVSVRSISLDAVLNALL